ncbi:unnamed protein product [Victoria cruziana]
MRRNHSVDDFRVGGARGGPARSRSSDDIYTRAKLEAAAANKESFFARKIAENESRPEGIPPSRGGKYVGFGSSGNVAPQRNNPQGDVLRDTVSVVSQGLGRLSLVAASAAQSAASAIQAGTMEISSKVREGSYDQKVNETVNVVASKTTEIGQRTWGLMKGVMAMASQKVEEYTKESGMNWQTGSWHSNGNGMNGTGNAGHSQRFGPENEGTGNSGGHKGDFSSSSFDSWDDWGKKTPAKEDTSKCRQTGDGWSGWDDVKDEDDDCYTGTTRGSGMNGKSSSWTGGGFH